jgi:hypothetical protein
MKTTREAVLFHGLGHHRAPHLIPTPIGRQVARQAMRGARLASAATGVYPQPVVVLRFWGETRESAIRVEVYRSGRLVVTRRDRVEVSLDPEVAEQIIAAAELALGDFNAEGCNTSQGGINADLYLLVRGEWSGSVCHGAFDWPRGPKTRELLKDISGRLPAGGVAVVLTGCRSASGHHAGATARTRS